MFAVACAERTKAFMPEACTLRGLELAEQLAEGVASESEYDTYRSESRTASPPKTPGPESWAWNLPYSVMLVVLPYRPNISPPKKAIEVCKLCATVLGGGDDSDRGTQEFGTQADLLRDIFGNPFRAVSFAPSWRTGTMVALASQMYSSRDFSAMPILADALQDAGCDDENILNHCRGGETHVRGCWVVDLILSRA
ncbi:hypothetical protein [Gemmata sp. SH-PL17]|uniref:hypothetical protein n=1 Tax=Gemmata sp. SH-PL17 TaxID=1630693 RepID=UPI001EF40868|nr:hypothetical protein [Gemmata sp. SH-PL17]